MTRSSSATRSARGSRTVGYTARRGRSRFSRARSARRAPTRGRAAEARRAYDRCIAAPLSPSVALLVELETASDGGLTANGLPLTAQQQSVLAGCTVADYRSAVELLQRSLRRDVVTARWTAVATGQRHVTRGTKAKMNEALPAVVEHVAQVQRKVQLLDERASALRGDATVSRQSTWLRLRQLLHGP